MLISPLSRRVPDRAQARIDEAGAEPAAAMAAEDPGGPLAPEGSCSATRCRRPWHNRTTVLVGQRVMRHFLPAGLILRRLLEAALAIALLALRVLAAPREAVLIALTGKTLRPPARRLAAGRRAVHVAVIAARAENHLPIAVGAVEQAAEVPHRGGR